MSTPLWQNIASLPAFNEMDDAAKRDTFNQWREDFTKGLLDLGADSEDLDALASESLVHRARLERPDADLQKEFPSYRDTYYKNLGKALGEATPEWEGLYADPSSTETKLSKSGLLLVNPRLHGDAASYRDAVMRSDATAVQKADALRFQKVWASKTQDKLLQELNQTIAAADPGLAKRASDKVTGDIWDQITFKQGADGTVVGLNDPRYDRYTPSVNNHTFTPGAPQFDLIPGALEVPGISIWAAKVKAMGGDPNAILERRKTMDLWGSAEDAGNLIRRDPADPSQLLVNRNPKDRKGVPSAMLFWRKDLVDAEAKRLKLTDPEKEALNDNLDMLRDHAAEQTYNDFMSTSFDKTGVINYALGASDQTDTMSARDILEATRLKADFKGFAASQPEGTTKRQIVEKFMAKLEDRGKILQFTNALSNSIFASTGKFESGAVGVGALAIDTTAYLPKKGLGADTQWAFSKSKIDAYGPIDQRIQQAEGVSSVPYGSDIGSEALWMGATGGIGKVAQVAAEGVVKKVSTLIAENTAGRTARVVSALSPEVRKVILPEIRDLAASIGSRAERVGEIAKLQKLNPAEFAKWQARVTEPLRLRLHDAVAQMPMDTAVYATAAARSGSGVWTDAYVATYASFAKDIKDGKITEAEAQARAVDAAGPAAIFAAAWTPAIMKLIPGGAEMVFKKKVEEDLTKVTLGQLIRYVGSKEVRKSLRDASRKELWTPLTHVLYEGAREGVEESVDETGQALWAMATYSPDMTVGQALSRIAHAGALGGIMGSGSNAIMDMGVPAAAPAPAPATDTAPDVTPAGDPNAPAVLGTDGNPLPTGPAADPNIPFTPTPVAADPASIPSDQELDLSAAQDAIEEAAAAAATPAASIEGAAAPADPTPADQLSQTADEIKTNTPEAAPVADALEALAAAKAAEENSAQGTPEAGAEPPSGGEAASFAPISGRIEDGPSVDDVFSGPVTLRRNPDGTYEAQEDGDSFWVDVPDAVGKTFAAELEKQTAAQQSPAAASPVAVDGGVLVSANPANQAFVDWANAQIAAGAVIYEGTPDERLLTQEDVINQSKFNAGELPATTENSFKYGGLGMRQQLSKLAQADPSLQGLDNYKASQVISSGISNASGIESAAQQSPASTPAAAESDTNKETPKSWPKENQAPSPTPSSKEEAPNPAASPAAKAASAEPVTPDGVTPTAPSATAPEPDPQIAADEALLKPYANYGEVTDAKDVAAMEAWQRTELRSAESNDRRAAKYAEQLKERKARAEVAQAKLNQLLKDKAANEAATKKAAKKKDYVAAQELQRAGDSLDYQIAEATAAVEREDVAYYQERVDEHTKWAAGDRKMADFVQRDIDEMRTAPKETTPTPTPLNPATTEAPAAEAKKPKVGKKDTAEAATKRQETKDVFTRLGLIPTQRQLTNEVGGNASQKKALQTEIAAEIEAKFPSVPAPEGTLMSAPVSPVITGRKKVQLPMVSETEGFFTNNPETTALQLDNGFTVQVPDGFVGLNPAIKVVDGMVDSAANPALEGAVAKALHPGAMAAAYKGSTARQEKSTAQTKGVEAGSVFENATQETNRRASLIPAPITAAARKAEAKLLSFITNALNPPATKKGGSGLIESMLKSRPDEVKDAVAARVTARFLMEVRRQSLAQSAMDLEVEEQDTHILKQVGGESNLRDIFGKAASGKSLNELLRIVREDWGRLDVSEKTLRSKVFKAVSELESAEAARAASGEGKASESVDESVGEDGASKGDFIADETTGNDSESNPVTDKDAAAIRGLAEHLGIPGASDPNTDPRALANAVVAHLFEADGTPKPVHRTLLAEDSAEHPLVQMIYDKLVADEFDADAQTREDAATLARAAGFELSKVGALYADEFGGGEAYWTAQEAKFPQGLPTPVGKSIEKAVGSAIKTSRGYLETNTSTEGKYLPGISEVLTRLGRAEGSNTLDPRTALETMAADPAFYGVDDSENAADLLKRLENGDFAGLKGIVIHSGTRTFYDRKGTIFISSVDHNTWGTANGLLEELGHFLDVKDGFTDAKKAALRAQIMRARELMPQFEEWVQSRLVAYGADANLMVDFLDDLAYSAGYQIMSDGSRLDRLDPLKSSPDEQDIALFEWNRRTLTDPFTKWVLGSNLDFQKGLFAYHAKNRFGMVPDAKSKRGRIMQSVIKGANVGDKDMIEQASQNLVPYSALSTRNSAANTFTVTDEYIEGDPENRQVYLRDDKGVIVDGAQVPKADVATTKERLLADREKSMARQLQAMRQLATRNSSNNNNNNNNQLVPPLSMFRSHMALEDMRQNKGAFKALGIAQDGTVPWVNLKAKIEKSFRKEEVSMVVPAIETMVAKGRVKVEDAVAALDALARASVSVNRLNATPEPRDGSSDTRDRMSELTHELDGLLSSWDTAAFPNGLASDPVSPIEFANNLQENLGDAYISNQLFQDVVTRYSEYHTLHTATPEAKFTESEAASARFQSVNPKKLEDMPDARDYTVEEPYVDTLTRAEKLEFAKSDSAEDLANVYSSPKFSEESHYPTRKNVIGFARAYDEMWNGKPGTLVFEAQSDWASKLAKNGPSVSPEVAKATQERRMELLVELQADLKVDLGAKYRGGWALDDFSESVDSISPNENTRAKIVEYRRLSDVVDRNHSRIAPNPLLTVYETLVLKAAIHDAKAKGQTWIAVTDDETAMMTEGHDTNARRTWGREDNPDGTPKNVTRHLEITKDEAQVLFDGGASFETLAKAVIDELPADIPRPGKLGSNGTWMHEASPILRTVYSVGWMDNAQKFGVESWEETKPERPSQEPGMRAAYNPKIGRTHAIMQKLTGDKGTRADFGVHQNQLGDKVYATIEERNQVYAAAIKEGLTPDQANARAFAKINKGSPVFKGKTNITAIAYDITKVKDDDLTALFTRNASPSKRVADEVNAFHAKFGASESQPFSYSRDGKTTSGVVMDVNWEEYFKAESEVGTDAVSTIMNVLRKQPGVLQHLANTPIYFETVGRDLHGKDALGRYYYNNRYRVFDTAQEFSNHVADAITERRDTSTRTTDSLISVGLTHPQQDAGATILHEVVHGFTLHEVVHNPEFKQGIESLLGQVRKALDPKGKDGKWKHYGLTNAEEFISEALSNSTFADLLRGVYVGRTSKLRSIFDSLMDLVGKLFSKDPNFVSALDDLVLQVHRNLQEFGELAADEHATKSFHSRIKDFTNETIGRGLYGKLNIAPLGIDPVVNAHRDPRLDDPFVWTSPDGDLYVDSTLQAKPGKAEQLIREEAAYQNLKNNMSPWEQRDLASKLKDSPDKLSYLPLIMDAAATPADAQSIFDEFGDTAVEIILRQQARAGGLLDSQMEALAPNNNQLATRNSISVNRLTDGDTRVFVRDASDHVIDTDLIGKGEDYEAAIAAIEETHGKLPRVLRMDDKLEAQRMAEGHQPSLLATRNASDRKSRIPVFSDRVWDTNAMRRIPFFGERRAEAMGKRGGWVESGIFRFGLRPNDVAQLQRAQQQAMSAAERAGKFFDNATDNYIKSRVKAGEVEADVIGTLNTALGSTRNWVDPEQEKAVIQARKAEVKQAQGQFLSAYAQVNVLRNAGNNAAADALHDALSIQLKADIADAHARQESAVQGLKDLSYRQTKNKQTAAFRDVLGKDRAYFDHLVEFRRKITALGKDIAADPNASDDLRAVISRERGLWLHRSYKLHSDQRWFDRINKRAPELMPIITEAERFLTGELVDRHTRRLLSENRAAREADRKAGTSPLTPKLSPTDADTQARAYVANSPGVLQAEFDDIMKYGRATQDGFGGKSSASTSVPGILRHRKNVPNAIRALWGEHSDPRINGVKALLAATQRVGNKNFLREFTEMGAYKPGVSAPGSFFLVTREQKDQLPETKGWEPIVSKDADNEAAPLAGFYGPPEVKDAISGMFDPKHQDRLLSLASHYTAYSMATKTVFSARSHIRNFIGNVGLVVANGNLTPSKLANVKHSVNLIHQDLFGSGTAESRARIEDLIARGVIHDNQVVGLMKELQHELSGAQDGDSALRTTLQVLADIKNKSMDRAGDFYQAGDDFWKIFSYYGEMDSLRNIYKPEIAALTTANDEAGLAALEESIKNEAAVIVRKTMPTYSQVPELARMVRGSAAGVLFAPYVSWTAEVIRTSANIVALSVSDMTSGNKRRAARGRGRLAGFALSQGLVSMLSKSTVLFAQAVLAWDGDDEDKKKGGLHKWAEGTAVQPSLEEERAARHFMPPWSQNASLLFIGRGEDGSAQYIDMSYTDPYDYWKQIYKAGQLAATQPGVDASEHIAGAMTESLKQAVLPFVGKQLLAGAILDVGTGNMPGNNDGKDWLPDSGGKAWDDVKDAAHGMITGAHEPDSSKWVDASLHVFNQALNPGIVESVQDVSKGLAGTVEGSKVYDTTTELANIGFGTSIRKINYLDAAKYKFRDAQKKSSAADYMLIKTLGNSGTMRDDQIERTYVSSQDGQRDAYAEARKSVLALQTLGFKPEQVVSTLRDAGFTKDATVQIMFNTYMRTAPEKNARIKSITSKGAQLKEQDRNAVIDKAVNQYPEFQPLLNQ